MVKPRLNVVQLYFALFNCFSQESKTSQRTEKDVDDDYPANQDSPTASELDDVLQSTPKNVESTPETVDDDLAIVGYATKKELLPGARILERKLKVG